jgi:ribose transport system substrate-binding protein
MLRHWLRPVLGFLVLTILVAAGCTGDNPPARNQEGNAKDANVTGANNEGGASGGKRIVFLINTPDPFWDACRAGFETGTKDWKLAESGYSATFESNNGTAQGQIDKLRQFATQSDIVAVAISVIQADNAALVEEMKNLQAKGVKIITVDGDVNRDQFRDARTYYIGTNNIEAGKVLGGATKTILQARKLDKGAYVQLVGYTDNDNGRNRMDGVKQGLGDAYTERDRMADETDKSRAQENVRNALTNHSDLVALIGIWAYNGPAISTVVNERMVRDKLAVVTFDAAEGSIEAMAEGNMDALCVQNPFDMGYQAVRLLKAMHEKDDAVLKEMFPNLGQPDGDVYTTGLRIVAPDKGSPLKADQFDSKTVEFMTLTQLREWLAKYKLKSS